MTDVNRYYKILELEPGASQEQVRQAYKGLVRVWHPDRFSHDLSLQQKAQERLKEINQAYEQLRFLLRMPASQTTLYPHQSQADREPQQRHAIESPVWPQSPLADETCGLWQERAARSRISRNLFSLMGMTTVRKVQLGILGALLILLALVSGQFLRVIFTPERASARELRAWARSLYAEKDYLRALPYFQEAVKKDPRHARTWYFTGYCHYKLGDYRKAEEAFRKAVRLEPGHAKTHYSLGRVYRKQGRLQDAGEAFREAIRLEPDYATAYKSLAVVYAKQERFQEALITLQQAIRLNPNNAAFRYELGRVYTQMGDREAALKEYEALRGLDNKKAAQLYELIAPGPEELLSVQNP